MDSKKEVQHNLYPSRIIVGTDQNDERLVKAAHEFAGLLQEGAIKENMRIQRRINGIFINWMVKVSDMSWLHS